MIRNFYSTTGFKVLPENVRDIEGTVPDKGFTFF